MSVQAMAWALGQDIKPAAAKLLLVAVANYADASNECWPSKEALAHDCSTDKSTVCKYLRQLSDAGYITIRKRHQGRVNDTSIITLLVAENPPVERKKRRNGAATTTGDTEPEGSGACATSSGAWPTTNQPEGSGAWPTSSGISTTRVVGPGPLGVVGRSRQNPSIEPLYECVAEQPDKMAGGDHDPTDGRDTRKSSSVKVRKKATPLPPDWQPDLAWAKARFSASDAALHMEAEKFRSYHESKGSLMKDWQRAWQYWLLNGISKLPRRTDQSSTSGKSSGFTLDPETKARLDREYEEAFQRARKAAMEGTYAHGE